MKNSSYPILLTVDPYKLLFFIKANAIIGSGFNLVERIALLLATLKQDDFGI